MNKKIIFNFFWILIIVIFGLLCFFTEGNKYLSDINFIFSKNNQYVYINASDICKQFDFCVKNGNDFKVTKNILKTDINTRLLEDSIESFSYVKNAEVYLSLNNELTIFIEQDNPFIKVITGDEIFFLSKNYTRLKPLKKQPSDILFFSGDIQSEDFRDLFHLANYVYSDGFFNSLIREVNYDNDIGYVLYLNVFDFEIEIGNINGLDEKFTKIKQFFNTIIKDYRLIENNKFLIKKLNVVYKKQIICVM